MEANSYFSLIKNHKNPVQYHFERFLHPKWSQESKGSSSKEKNLLFGSTQAHNNSKQTILIDSIAKTRSQNKTLEASLALLSRKLDLIQPRGPLYLH